MNYEKNKNKIIEGINNDIKKEKKVDYLILLNGKNL